MTAIAGGLFDGGDRLPPPIGPPGGLYLLHLEPRYKHAGHYLGWAVDIDRRIAEHRAGGSKASPLVRAAIAAGADVQHVRTWAGGSRTLERRLKRGGGLSRHCPTCRAAGAYHA
jgi:hypothetical protein